MQTSYLEVRRFMQRHFERPFPQASKYRYLTYLGPIVYEQTYLGLFGAAGFEKASTDRFSDRPSPGLSIDGVECKVPFNV